MSGRCLAFADISQLVRRSFRNDEVDRLPKAGRWNAWLGIKRDYSERPSKCLTESDDNSIS